MKIKERVFKETFYVGFSRRDGSLLYYNFIESALSSDSVLADIGCGRGESEDGEISYVSGRMNFKGKVKKVIGLDVDPAGEENPKIDEFRLIESELWPLTDNSIDVLIADFVIEHVENPQLFFREIHRVLKTEGKFFLRTSNSLGYVALISKILPERYHTLVLGRAQRTRQDIDVFPAFYRVNTIPKIQRVLRDANLRGTSFTYEGEPAYFKFSLFLYRLVAYTDVFIPSIFKNSIIVVGQK